MDGILGLLKKYREQVMYVIFGGLTTLVNMVIYYCVNGVMGMATVPSTALAQVAAVAFAYVTNRRYVFRSTARGARAILREMGSFFACRAASFFLDIGIMWVSVDLLCWPNMLMKIVSNVIIVVVNYLASRLLIFKRGMSK